MIDPVGSWVFARLLCGEHVNGELAVLPEPFRTMAAHLAEAKGPKTRQSAWSSMLAARPDRGELLKAVADADPTKPAPAPDPTARAANLADMRNLVADDDPLWKGWITRGVCNALAADPGCGKTVMTVDLARRINGGLQWPDGQPPTLPPGSKTLWLPADRHYGQLLSLAAKFGLPDDAMLFNAPPTDPTGGIDLDDPETLSGLAARIQSEGPALVVIDTVGQTTAKNLCRPEDAREYFGPLMDLAVSSRTAFLLLTHLSKEGQALGRRINGACRIVWKMTAPDPDGQPNRRRVAVDKSYTERPPALGMSIGEAGCEFDFHPPSEPDPGGGGRPRDQRDACRRFIRGALESLNDRTGNELLGKWEASGGNGKTFWRAVDEMEQAGELATEGGRGTGKQKVLHLIRGDDFGPA